MQGKTSEPSNFDPLTLGKGAAELVENASNGQLDIGLTQMGLFPGEAFYQFGFCHC
jgi:hypothetical protein